MEIHERKISELIHADYNPRQLTTDQYEQIESSLKTFGMVDPVIINQHPDRLNIIVGGHQRAKIWEKLGNETIPCVYVSLELDKERELNIRLNKNVGEWNWDGLANNFEIENLLDWGFKDWEIGGPPSDHKPPDWGGMPEYDQENQKSFQNIRVHFKTVKERNAFAELIKQDLSDTTKSIWYPKAAVNKIADKTYSDES